MSKTDLKARPIFHQTKQAFEARLTAITASLALARNLQERSGMSIKRLIRPLKNILLTTGEINGHKITLQDPATGELEPTLKN